MSQVCVCVCLWHREQPLCYPSPSTVDQISWYLIRQGWRSTIHEWMSKADWKTIHTGTPYIYSYKVFCMYFSSVFTSPLSFLSHPYRWLRLSIKAVHVLIKSFSAASYPLSFSLNILKPFYQLKAITRKSGLDITGACWCQMHPPPPLGILILVQARGDACVKRPGGSVWWRWSQSRFVISSSALKDWRSSDVCILTVEFQLR